MDPKLSKKIRKRLSKILPKPETISNKFQEIQSEFRKFKEEFTGSRSASVDSDSYACGIQNTHFDEFSNDSSPYMTDFDVEQAYYSAETTKSKDTDASEIVYAAGVTFKNLSCDLQSMLDNGYFADVTIKCGSEELKVHKCVLSARSPVFLAMFNTPMLESKHDTVTLNDVDYSVLRALMSFLYTGQIKNLDVATACGLLQSAEKYQIDNLKSICTRYIKANLCIENCLCVLQKMELYSEELKNGALAFICDVFSVLQLTQEWNDLQQNDPALSLKIYSSVVGKLQNEK